MNPVQILIMAMQKFLPNSTLQQVESVVPDSKAFRVYPNAAVLPGVSLPLEIPNSFNLLSNGQILDILEPKIRWLKSEFQTLEIVDPPDPVLEAEKTDEEKEAEKLEQSRISLVGAMPWLKT